MRVVAALSGGVDSSVAAARAIDAGHEVVGVHFALSKSPTSHRVGSRGCCTLEDSRDARRVADVLGIPFYVWDFSDEFVEKVINDFLDEYRAGRTPNPCVRCNERIKFAAVLDRAIALGFDAVCTGHYAQIVDGQLRRAVDGAKDQSYVLAVLNDTQLAHSMFPLGNDTKANVRAEAEQRGLLTASKPDSHDICFIPDGDTAGFLRKHLPDASGAIVDIETGETLARHEGTYGFTVGQRRGLGIGQPAEDHARRYVIELDPQSHTVFVGPPTLLDVDELVGHHVIWTGDEQQGDHVLVQVRAHADPVPGRVQRSVDTVTVYLDEPIRGVARGQTMVVYDGDVVLGSATIDATRRR